MRVGPSDFTACPRLWTECRSSHSCSTRPCICRDGRSREGDGRLLAFGILRGSAPYGNLQLVEHLSALVQECRGVGDDLSEIVADDFQVVLLGEIKHFDDALILAVFSLGRFIGIPVHGHVRVLRDGLKLPPVGARQSGARNENERFVHGEASIQEAFLFDMTSYQREQPYRKAAFLQVPLREPQVYLPVLDDAVGIAVENPGSRMKNRAVRSSICSRIT